MFLLLKTGTDFRQTADLLYFYECGCIAIMLHVVSVLVEVASARLEKHRIFCVSLNRRFVTLEGGAVLVQV